MASVPFGCMRIRAIILVSLVCCTRAAGYVSQVDLPVLEERVAAMSMEKLEERRTIIEAQLERLARFAMNSGVGRIGYRSVPHDTPEAVDWIEIDFDQAVTVDSILLVPAIWRDADKGFVADAFPAAFEITAGAGDPGDGMAGTVIARFDGATGILPRIAPFAIDGKGTKAKWLRVTATRLSPRKFDGLFVLQLSEILVFDGTRNVARGRVVRTSSSVNYGSGAWGEEYLVDGFLPYLMVSAMGPGSVAYVSTGGFEKQPQFWMDLGDVYHLDSMVLHVVEQTDTVPQAFPGDFGVPFEFTLEGSLTEDFAHPAVLLEYERDSVFDVGPIMSLELNPAGCRYVRLTATRPYIFSYINEAGLPVTGSRFGFAEIELYTSGDNVARGKKMHSRYEADTSVRHVEALTDGSNLYGRILPLWDWMDQLAKRHDLEVELPRVNAELQLRYASQKRILYLMRASLVGLVILLIIATLIYRTRQQRLLFKTRERITADLHDVLGGNISAIALLGQLAISEVQNPGEVSGYLSRITNLAARTRNSLKYISDMLSQPGLYENLPAEMRRIATGLTEGIEHDFTITGEEYISRIDQQKRVDIFLFYKECLVNVIRHSRATSILTHLEIDASAVKLDVADNGVGLPGGETAAVPPSLRRRARILGGKVVTSTLATGGTRIQLYYKWNQTWLEKLLHLPFSLR